MSVARRLTEPVAFLAFVVWFPIRVWRRARRDRTSLAEAMQANGDEAYAQMSPEMRAEVDAARDEPEAPK